MKSSKNNKRKKLVKQQKITQFDRVSYRKHFEEAVLGLDQNLIEEILPELRNIA